MQKAQQFRLVDFILEFSTCISSSLHEDVSTILISDTLKLKTDDIVLFETLFCSLLCKLCSEDTHCSDSPSLYSFSLSSKDKIS